MNMKCLVSNFCVFMVGGSSCLELMSRLMLLVFSCWVIVWEFGV